MLSESVLAEIIVVDDSVDNLKLLTTLLAGQGYRVRPAFSGVMALRSAAVRVPDLFLLDVRIPDPDGYTVCRRIKSDPLLRAVPVIFVSALNEPADKIEGFSAGGVDYITKPFDPAEVLARVRIHLELRRLQIRQEQVRIELEQQVAIRTAELAKANEALRKSESLLNEAQHLTCTGGWEYDVVSKKLTWTDEVYRIHGLTPEEYDPNDLSRNMAFYTHGDESVIERAFKKALEEGKPYDLDLRFRNARGEDKWVRTIGKPERRDGRVVRVFGNIVDITERRRAEEALKLSDAVYREIFNTVNDTIWIHDIETFRFVDVNSMVTEMFGYSVEEALNLSVEDISSGIPPFTQDTAAELLRKAAAGQPQLFEWHTRHKDGRLFWTEVNLRRGTIAGKECLLAIERDITARKAAEEELIRLNQELDERVKARTAELSAAKEQAESANQAKSTFLANISHELRSPLNTVLGFTNLLLREAQSGREGLTESQRESLEIVHRSAEHLLTLINDVLELSRIEAGRIAVTQADCDLHELLNGVQSMFTAKAQNKGLTLRFSSDPTVPRHVRTDEVKLRQVLINLVSNAIKFTDKGGVTVTVGESSPDQRLTKPRTEEPGNLRLRFEVSDSGPGISQEERGILFEPFAQTLIGQRKREGTGLGLAISREFVELMGGEITVRSAPGEGSVFRFEIDAQKVEGSDFTPKPVRPSVIGLAQGQPSYRILVVDDDPMARQLLVGFLGPLGFNVRGAADGLEAMEAWETWKPHLIWMDMRMPRMDGREATRRIKATPGGDETKIIAVTAGSFAEDRASFLEAGCDDFLLKPYRDGELLGMMEKHLGVKYVYAERDRIAALEDSGIKSPVESLKCLPAGLLERLENAAVRAGMDEIAQLILEAEAWSPDEAAELKALADGFDFPAIVVLVRKTRESLEVKTGTDDTADQTEAER